MFSLVALLLSLVEVPIVIVPIGEGTGPASIIRGFHEPSGTLRHVLGHGLTDAAGRPVRGHLHMSRGRAVWCAVMDEVRSLPLVRSPRRVAFRPIAVTRGAGGHEVKTGALDVELLVDGGLRSGDLVVRPVGPRRRGTWVFDHVCRARVTALYTAMADGSRTSRRWTWTFHAGTTRIDAAQHVEAEEATALAAGVGFEVTLRGAGAVRVGEIVVEEGARIERRDGGWRDPGEDREVARPAADALTITGPSPWSMASSSGMEVVARSGDRVVVLGAPPGTGLDRGEGRVMRCAFLRGVGAPAAAPLVRRAPRRLAPATEPQSTVRPLLDRLLDDAEHGVIQDGPGRGDWRFGPEDVGNGEYDTILGWVRFAETRGHDGAIRAARRMADHLLSEDRDAAGSGLFFPHGPGHRRAAIEIGHHWIEGLVMLGAREPDTLRRLMITELLMAQLTTLEGADLDRQLPRSLGWGLLALAIAAEQPGPHRPRTRAAVRRWRREILARQTPRGWLHLVALAGDPDLGNENPFVQGGIILPALVASLRAVPSARDRPAVRRLAAALGRTATHEVDDVRRLARRVALDVRTGRVLSRSGAAPGEHAALFLAGLRSAGRRGIRGASLAALASTISATLRASRKRYIGPEVSILLRSIE